VDFGAHLASCSKLIKSYFTEDKSAGAWSWEFTSISYRCYQKWSYTPSRPRQFAPREN